YYPNHLTTKGITMNTRISGEEKLSEENKEKRNGREDELRNAVIDPETNKWKPLKYNFQVEAFESGVAIYGPGENRPSFDTPLARQTTRNKVKAIRRQVMEQNRIDRKSREKAGNEARKLEAMKNPKLNIPEYEKQAIKQLTTWYKNETGLENAKE